MIPAEALARALHPERDAQIGDWGQREWTTMRPEWREAAVESAQRTIYNLARLNFSVVPYQEHVEVKLTPKAQAKCLEAIGWERWGNGWRKWVDTHDHHDVDVLAAMAEIKAIMPTAKVNETLQWVMAS